MTIPGLTFGKLLCKVLFFSDGFAFFDDNFFSGSFFFHRSFFDFDFDLVVVLVCFCAGAISLAIAICAIFEPRALNPRAERFATKLYSCFRVLLNITRS